ncbi:ABC transporter [Calidifontibacter sp. DB0510]|uniref:ABC transporter n=1 Tax=Metallococcus carri TaxID=1656884 RepID=A0A967AZB0_9MICO|nr:dynamin family protein [Metallococcus carri]NHN55866.1 ABC transporter [Metallococcus carri]NOP38446.1 ABC transporter [Calidifontibacter sp. DB2511S]
MTPADDPTTLPAALHQLRAAVEATRLPLDTPDAPTARSARTELLNQLDDYIIPRASSLDAPLLAVVGGSTGAGKSTLVNSVVGEIVTKPGVLRPTTRASTLIHNPRDERWFTGDRVLPGLARLSGADQGEQDPATLRLVSSDNLPLGLALLDAPDIDSVVSANRDLARQLLSAADLWIFVTTATRYADAVPWDLLHQAAQRGTSLAIVLDRVPLDAMEEVRSDLAGMLADQGLGQSPVFAVAESKLSADGMLPLSEVVRIRGWLGSLASDAHARQIVIRRTLDGALASLDQRANALRNASSDQVAAVRALRQAPETAYAGAIEGVKEGMRDGTLLRGEVLARWQEFVGTGELLRQLEAGVGKLRDRVVAFARGRGKQEPAENLGEALHEGVAALLLAHAETAAITTVRQWRALPGGAPLADGHKELAAVSPAFHERVERLVRDWQGDVLQMVRDEAGEKRSTARFLAFGVNGIAVMLMIITFSATAGLSGAEIGIAGGSAVLAQRLLEAVFGDQAVRTLSMRARARLLERTKELYDAESGRFGTVLDTVTEGATDRDLLGPALQGVNAAR